MTGAIEHHDEEDFLVLLPFNKQLRDLGVLRAVYDFYFKQIH